ncbi:MAG TPA: chitobiase/beta-hexosaminidase C-terminal domain-containing protein [Polyangiaceae bacterium]
MGVLASLSLAGTLACSAAMMGCGGDDNQSPTGDDGGVDTGTPVDSGTDAGHDATTTVTPDAGVDAKVDTGAPDTGTTPPPDAGPDSPPLSACATPTFMPAPGTVAQGTSVTLSAANLPTTNGFIYYTVDGTIPTHNSPVFSAPIALNQSETIHAVAFAQGVCTDSTVATGVYTVLAPDAGPPDVVTLPQCGIPTLTPNGGAVASGSTVTITPAAGFPAGGFVFYTTDGTLPTHASPLYSGPIQVTQNETIHAIAFASGTCEDSVLATASFTVTVPPVDAGGPPAVPTFTPTSVVQNNDFSVALTSTAGATICYTTDGTTTPTCTNGTCNTGSQTYGGTGISITGSITNANGQVTVTAIACRAGVASSASASQQYTLQAAMPTAINPAPGILPYVSGGYTPTLSSATTGATMRTATGSTLPTCITGTTAANPSTFTLTANGTLNVVACKTGYAPSANAPLAYGIKLNNSTLTSATAPLNSATAAAGIDDTANASSGDWLCESTTATPSCGTTASTCATGAMIAGGGLSSGSVALTATGTSVNVIGCSLTLTASNVVTGGPYTLQLAPPDINPPGLTLAGDPATSFSVPVGGITGAINVEEDGVGGDENYSFVCAMLAGTPQCGTNACTVGTKITGVSVGTPAALGATPVAGDVWSVIGCPAPTGASSGYQPSAVTTVSYGAPGAAGAPSIAPIPTGPLTAMVAPVITNSDATTVTLCTTTNGTTPTCTGGTCGVGAQSTGIAGINAATVTSVNITNGGAGYVGTPLVTLSGGGGTGATATATLTGGAVTSITVTAAGSGYSTAPTVSFSGGGPTTAATATAVVNNSVVLTSIGTDNQKVLAVACSATKTASTVSTQTYNFAVSEPDFSFVQTTIVNGDLNAGGTVGAGQSIRLSTASNFASESIHYTTNGVAATCSTGTVISAASGNIVVAAASPLTLSAIGCGTAQQASAVRAATFTVTAATPTLTAQITGSPTGDVSWQNTFNTVISSVTTGAQICYTTNGTTPTCSAGTCGGSGATIPATNGVSVPITVSGTQLRAVACTATLASTATVAAANYTLTISNVLATGTLACPSTVTVGLDTTGPGGPTHGVEICYTTDGTTPLANCTSTVANPATCFTSGGAGAGTSTLQATSSASLNIVACDTGFLQPASIATGAAVTAYSNTITVDGAITLAEWPAGDRLASTTVGTLGLLSHDATNLYFGATGYTAAAGTDVVIYLGDGTGGSTAPPPVFGATTIPFGAKWAFGWDTSNNAGSNVQAFAFSGSAWTATTLAGLTVGFQSANNVEFGLPIADVGTPTTVNVAGAIVTGVGTSPATATRWPELTFVPDALASCQTPLAQVAPPTITSLTPNAIPSPGTGTPVTITGTGFTGATAVTFGAGSPAFVVVSDTSITTTAPGAGLGPVQVTVTTPFGTSNGATFTYTP